VATKLNKKKAEAAGFDFGASPYRRGKIIEISGPPGGGKTHLALTAVSEGPLAYLYTDLRHDGVIQRFERMGEIAKANLSGYHIPRSPKIPKGTRQDDITKLMSAEMLANIEALEGMVEAWGKAHYTAIDSGFRSIVWDKENEFWEVLRAAEFLRKVGRAEKVPGVCYTEVNSRMRAMLRAAETADVLLLLIRDVKKEYVGDKPTGGWEETGFNGVRALATTSIRMVHNTKEDAFVGTILKSGIAKEHEGRKLTNPTMYELLSLTVPDVEWVRPEGVEPVGDLGGIDLDLEG
jgi:hypothetical protein